MAKYYLTENGKPKTLNEVTWAKLNFSDYDPTVLEDIDKFCMSFSNEEEIKKHLVNVAVNDLNDGLITAIPNFKNQLNIRFVHGKAVRTLSYGLPYKSDHKYFDYHFLRDYLLSLRNDATFLLRLSKSFDKSPIQLTNTALIYRKGLSLRNGTSFYEEDRFHDAMTDFVRVEVLKYDKAIKGYTTDSRGNVLYQWRKLHDLAMFVINYTNQSQATKPTVQKEKPVEIEESPQLTLF